MLQQDLDNHMRTHSLPFKCDMCEKGFTANSKLRDHIRKVHERKHLSCRFGCGYKSMSRFMVHMVHEKKNCALNPKPGKQFLGCGQDPNCR